jgi:anaerobic magnesium-protoporphyrin IX monomethyl ester cyclase
MMVLFANIPFIKYDDEGNIRTGPNAGSRWPWTGPGITPYACFPFFMGYAVNYLRMHGVDAQFYDAVALQHWNYDLVKQTIAACKPDILVLETSTPLFPKIKEFAIWAKEEFSSRVVLTGPHLQAYAKDLIREPFVDHCVVGEYEIPVLDIARNGDRAHPLYTFEHLEDINFVNGDNFLPYRPMDYLFNYWDPSMDTLRPQLAVNTSRGCPFKCTYCQWPKVMNGGKYRNRQPALVIDEIRTVIQEYRRHRVDSAKRGALFPRIVRQGIHNLKGLLRSGLNERQGTKNTASSSFEIGSIFFDDDTWNLGNRRITELCGGLKAIGLPWTMMGRIDTSSLEIYDLMVESGCVGMRFGIESFNQQLLDNTKKNLDARKSYENVKHLITRFSKLEFHFTTMKNLPGETEQDWENDLKILNELKTLGERSNNIIHWQNSDCVAFPGTELWEELVALGKNEDLKDFALYDGDPGNDGKLAEAVGWLGSNYKPKPSRYSGMGQPTNLPKE